MLPTHIPKSHWQQGLRWSLLQQEMRGKILLKCKSRSGLGLAKVVLNESSETFEKTNPQIHVSGSEAGGTPGMKVCGLIVPQLQELHFPGGIFKEPCRKSLNKSWKSQLKLFTAVNCLHGLSHLEVNHKRPVFPCCIFQVRL